MPRHPSNDAFAPDPRAVAAARRYAVRTPIILAFLTVAVHGLALFDGVILDDYWHQKGLREYGWSFSDLMRTLIIRPADFLHVWWQTKDVVWHYLRPFFIVCMKFVYVVLGRGDPVFLHAVSILLHYVCALLVWRLCWRLTRSETWSTIGAVLFIIYPHSIITVAWPSSQNVVIQTALLLGALLLYLRASRLEVGPEAAMSRSISADRAPPPLSLRHAVGVFTLWLLAILTRENAVLFPAILASFDFAFGGRRRLWARRGWYALLLVVAAAFAAWRIALQIPPLPEVYCRHFDGRLLEYGGWLVAKLLHYLCASVWIAPLSAGPTGRYNPWVEAPGDVLLMLAIVVVIGGVYWRAARTARGWWIWPIWILLSVFPSIAVVATPHAGYMSGVGFAVGAALAPAVARATQPRRFARFAAGVVVFLFLGTGFMAAVNRLQWYAVDASEKYAPDWVMVSPPSREARHVFFVNLPFANVYIKPNLVARLGDWFEDVQVHALTFSPQILEMNQRTTLQQIDDRTFSVAIDGEAWFSRLMGRFFLEGFRGPTLFRPGDLVETDEFTARVLDADDRGVWKLQFAFRRPLSDPAYCFYLASPRCGAARLTFDRAAAAPDGSSVHNAAAICDPIELNSAAALLEHGRAAAALPLFATAVSDESPLADDARGHLRGPVEYMAAVLGAPIQPLLDRPDPSRDDWRRVADWWAAAVTDEAMRGTWEHRRDFEYLEWLRSEIEWDRFLAGFVFRCDLYLTGQPFTNPRGY